jgi:iron-sulfur cluster insertion protein
MIRIDAAAESKIAEIIEANKPADKNLYLRVFVQGGGCSGFQYGFTLDEDKNDDDFEFDRAGFTLLVDSMSMNYLNDAEVSYKEDVYGSNFTINNPNATTTCGCGSSFSV